MSAADLPDPNQVDGAPHPRDTPRLIGQSRAEVVFLEAFTTGRLHHGWLLTGPRGIGKATLAWRIARFLLATPQDDGGMFGAPPAPDTLDIAPDHPIARRITAQSEPGVFLLKRGPNDRESALSADIRVGEVRKLKSFLHLSAAEGGRRVVIVDAADDMNPNAANALLKLLEEPPSGVTFLLIAHQPAGLLPTIRSRCRELRLNTLGADDMAAALAQAGAETDNPAALAALAGGSVGEAIRLTNLDGLAQYARLVTLMDSLPRLDRPRALALADQTTGKGNEAKFDLTLGLIELFLARLARAGAAGPTLPEAAPGEAALLARLAPGPGHARHWANLHQRLGARARHGRAVNLDPAALVMDMVLEINEAASA
ncbi:DNA polymerase III subunit delta' [Phaeovulum sp.]|uniref:DNA polymerase III subunit delta' n=1 Tax=Phaeovulum sp. TaxID=2934796 RepID=UPI0039E5840F